MSKPEVGTTRERYSKGALKGLKGDFWFCFVSVLTLISDWPRALLTAIIMLPIN